MKIQHYSYMLGLSQKIGAYRELRYIAGIICDALKTEIDYILNF